MEKIVMLNKEGIIQNYIEKNKIGSDEIFAAELVLIFIPDVRKVVLFNRGSGACDMHSRWALHSGKVNINDLNNGDEIGKKLSITAFKNAAIREFREELKYNISPNQLKLIDQFYMPEKDKKIFFTLFSLELTINEFKKLYPDFAEVDAIKLFTLGEFKKNQRLGDAIKFKKEKIMTFLTSNGFEQIENNSLQNVFVIVCNGISDIGKGWLTASIGRLAPESTLPIKIDPLLNLAFPPKLGIEINNLCDQEDIDTFVDKGRAESGDFRISGDFEIYKDAEMKIYPECNIVAGDLIKRFLESNAGEIRPGEIKKRTFNDLSRFLANEIAEIVDKRKPKTLLIEIGGTIEDNELIYIPGALRFLSRTEYLNIDPEIILLTYFDFAEPHIEGAHRIKTQYIRRGIITVSKAYYGLPLKACFVRRRHVPIEISDDVLKKDLKNIAYETQIDPDKIIFLPNVKKNNMKDLTTIIKETNLFKSMMQ